MKEYDFGSIAELFKQLSESGYRCDDFDGDILNDNIDNEPDEEDDLELFKAIKQSIKAAKDNKEIISNNLFIIFNSPVYPQRTMRKCDIDKSMMVIESSLSVLQDILFMYERRNKLYKRALKDLNMNKRDLRALITFYETAKYCINNHRKRLEEIK